MKYNDKAGFTLLEATLGVAVGAVLLASLLLVFKVGKHSWNVNNQQSELLQHARIAMARLSSELRYATGLSQASISTIGFPTKVLVNADSATTEVIEYTIVSNTLQRSVDGGVKSILAGDIGRGISAVFTGVVPVKVDVSGNVVPLSLADPLSLAVGLEVEMTFQDSYSKSVKVKTMITFRGV